jgi:hypothetical protein
MRDEFSRVFRVMLCLGRRADQQLRSVGACLSLIPLLCASAGGCASNVPPATEGSPAPRVTSGRVTLHGRPLELHLAAPVRADASRVLVLYASGDGGWFGAAVDMFRTIAGAGYYTAGFSSRAFLRLERPKGSLVSAEQLAEEYERIIGDAHSLLSLAPDVPTIVTGWSRGASFAVLVASEPLLKPHLAGVVAIGLAEGEDLAVSDDDDDEGGANGAPQVWPFEPYKRIPEIDPLPCAVIQASGDNFLPAARAKTLFGPETPLRRFYTVEASNHRFSGGRTAFASDLLDALRWARGHGVPQGASRRTSEPQALHFVPLASGLWPQAAGR